MYRPSKPFNVGFVILNPTYKKELGKNIPIYSDKGEVIYCSFLSFGGTETEVNGVISIKDTANVETWYRPDIKSDTRLKRLDDAKVFEIMGEPEDIEHRHQFLKFKIESLRGSRG